MVGPPPSAPSSGAPPALGELRAPAARHRPPGHLPDAHLPGVRFAGCGAGRAAGEPAERGMRAIGVDVGERMIAAARARGSRADFRLGDALDLPLGDGEVAG
uniref:methyltransferase domain-containing protein n=1 Tax=Nonomuraea pusilla TaxID=46177 RepID=UPI00128EA044|nr:methyltransferase domain-containing protein [Nonomuraea pusilla]